MRTSKFPLITKQRFWTKCLNELFTRHAYQIKKFVEGLDTWSVIAKVIEQIQYPFFLGKPNDSHQFVAFRDKILKWKFRRCVELDFFQTAEETVVIGIGDCEDTSILTVTCLGCLGVKAEHVFVTIGIVKDAETNQPLGGHAWVVFKETKWYLIETTLDSVPSEYPVVNDITKEFRYKNIIYEPYQLFNWQMFKSIRPFLFGWNMHSRKKYEALSKVFDRKAGPLALLPKLSWLGKLLSRLRWRD